jgi:hypothetical protein
LSLGLRRKFCGLKARRNICGLDAASRLMTCCSPSIQDRRPVLTLIGRITENVQDHRQEKSLAGTSGRLSKGRQRQGKCLCLKILKEKRFGSLCKAGLFFLTKAGLMLAGQNGALPMVRKRPGVPSDQVLHKPRRKKVMLVSMPPQ